MNTIDPRFEEQGQEPPNDDMLAAEYVLGVLDGDAHRRAQARAAAEPAFAQLVAAWEERLAPLADHIQPQPVPPHLWPRIRTRLGWMPVEGGKPKSVWQNVSLWRGATALAAAAAVLAIFIGRAPPSTTPTQPPPVAVQPPPERAKPVTTLAHDDGTPGWLASIDVANESVLMVPVPADPDAQGRVAELWLIPPGQSPRSLGLVSTNKAHSVKVPKALMTALAAGSILAITLEPPGGAPRGVPTGPIVAKGNIQTI